MSDTIRNCLFCKIINKEVPSDQVYEDDYIIAFRDINPQAKEHILVVPKKHIAYISDISDDETLNHIFPAIHSIAKQLDIRDSGYRIVVNKGPDACQSIFHLHFHILGGEQLSGKMA